MKHFRYFWIACALNFFPIGLYAQAPASGPCPPGAVPIPGQGRCGSPAEASAINSRGAGNSAPAYTEIWEDRYGAIAEDYQTGKGGVSTGMKSKRQAERLALSRCGVNDCKIVSSARNACQAVAYGENGRALGSGGSKIDAEVRAKANCEASGSICEISYAGCSLPVRVK